MPVPTTSHPVDRHLSVSFTEWEEPHPGRRLSCSANPIMGEQQDSGQGAQRVEGFVDSTVGTQNSTSHGLQSNPIDGSSQYETLAAAYERTASASPPGIISSGPNSAIPGSLSGSPSLPLTFQAPGIYADDNLANPDNMTVDADDNSPQSPSLALSPISEYEDVSHYLDGPSGSANSPGSDSLSSMVDVSSPSAYSHAAPFEDMYGWDAEWGRRSASPVSDTDAAVENNYSNRHSSLLSRRGRANKHGLLQRVLSVGKAPSRTSTSRRARFSP